MLRLVMIGMLSSLHLTTNRRIAMRLYKDVFVIISCGDLAPQRLRRAKSRFKIAKWKQTNRENGLLKIAIPRP